jgi:hypothetical protein
VDPEDALRVQAVDRLVEQQDLPKCSVTPWRTGSSASWRVPWRAAWMPTHVAEQWSTAMKTATWPSSTVRAAVMSVPHIASMTSGMIVPSWLRGPRGRPALVAAARPFSRISRRTRSFEVRNPAWRSRAHTLR